MPRLSSALRVHRTASQINTGNVRPRDTVAAMPEVCLVTNDKPAMKPVSRIAVRVPESAKLALKTASTEYKKTARCNPLSDSVE